MKTKSKNHRAQFKDTGQMKKVPTGHIRNDLGLKIMTALNCKQ